MILSGRSVHHGVDPTFRVESHCAMQPWSLRVQDNPPVVETGGGTERWAGVFLCIMAAGFAATFGLLAILRRQELARSVQDVAPAFVALMVLLVAASVWAVRRVWRMGLRIDDEGVTIRNFRRTYLLGWHHVSHFQDGIGRHKETTPQWALSVVLRDGRAVVVRDVMVSQDPGGA